MRKSLSKRENLNTVGALGAFLVALAALLVPWITQSLREDLCPIGQFLQIMDMEATAALQRDVDKAVSLYAPGAVVRDARGELSWSGLDDIRGRYSSLQEFSKLEHIDVTVTCDEDGELARAQASTTGVMVNADGSTTPISSVDGEAWTFQKVGGKWKIRSFSYNRQ